MRNKKNPALLAGMALSLALGATASGQTNGPGAPSGLRLQALSESTESPPVLAAPAPETPGGMPSTPLPPGSIEPRQGIEPVQPPPPAIPALPGPPPLNRPPVLTNHSPVFTNQAPIFTNHPPGLLPGDI